MVQAVCCISQQFDTGILSVYTNGSLKNLGTVSYKAGAAAFFKDIGLDLGVGVLGLMSSTLVELQAIVLALKCVLLSSSIRLFLDSQSALNTCWYLPPHLNEHFIVADGGVVSGNSKYFVHNIYYSISLFKNFVFCDWFYEAVSVFHDPKLAGLEIVKFVYSLSMAFRNDICLALILVSGLALEFSAGVVKLLSVTDVFGISSSVLVHIAA
ncbi:hypothetical protein G9A89_012797 [Geosiphon pyriformis]|nr:hypothetical protein G9A89_012797 [Geosiphon pyriformis]